MSDFAQALEAKISVLEAAKASLLTEASDIDVKITLLKELQADESDATPAPKKRGRPPKNVVKKSAKENNYASNDPTILAEAQQMEGTDPELAARLAGRVGNRSAGAVKGYGPGIRAGSKEAVLKGGTIVSPGAAQISIEDDENEPV